MGGKIGASGANAASRAGAAFPSGTGNARTVPTASEETLKSAFVSRPARRRRPLVAIQTETDGTRRPARNRVAAGQ